MNFYISKTQASRQRTFVHRIAQVRRNFRNKQPHMLSVFVQLDVKNADIDLSFRVFISNSSNHWD
jgi:hypothetical protein